MMNHHQLHEASLYGSLNHGDHRCLNMNGLNPIDSTGDGGGSHRNGRGRGGVRGSVVSSDGMNVFNTHNNNTVLTTTPVPSQMTTLIQLVIAFLVAGFGNVGAGLILDYVKEWPVFMHLNELFVLVPSLLGLKGNLELTMASRLSTQANLGHMDNIEELHSMAKGNLALVQCQATVVSFVVALFASFVRSISTIRDDSLSPYLDDQTNDLSATTNLLVSSMLNNHQQPLHNASLLINGSSSSSLLANSINNNRIGIGSNTKIDSNINNINNNNDEPIFSSTAIVESHLNGFDWNNSLVLCASSLLTANIACFVLGSMMILVIVGSHRINIDPDNIASPVAASLGDMTTAGLLAIVAHSIYSYSESQRLPYLALLITLVFLGMLPVWWDIARKNPYTADVVTKGWTPIVLAVFISSSGGMILEYGKSRFSRLPVFQPVVNGVGGNLVAVQASRLATSLHKIGKPGDLPANFKLFTSPFKVFFKQSTANDTNSSIVRLLLFISIPAHLLYFYVIRAIEHESHSEPVTMLFLSLYMLFAVLQVAILLYLAQNLVCLLWRCRIDPDNYSTPLLTATGDLLGCGFLLVVFVVAYQFNDPYATTIL